MLVTRHVEIPEALMEAQAQGQLVLFVGAGASFAPPSNLPLFTTLAESIATETNSRFTAEELKNPSRLLSRLADNQISVHRLAHARISKSPAPNHIHTALVDLFPDFDSLRIVTTNWDRHLTTAATARFGRQPAVHHAPALPLGRDFNGIVHLHGCLDQPPEKLIITESDFGQAYLTDAYCARFVHDMFRTYTVLFVGYSNDDVIMYHLGRGLTANAKPRFGFINDGVSAEWRALGINPIVYPSTDGHAALGAGLEAWASLNRSGHLDYERRVISLLASASMPRSNETEASGIAWNPEDDSFMQYVLADPQRVVLFTKNAGTDVRLLEWAAQTPAFREMFPSGQPLTAVGHAISLWFADQFATHAPDVALSIVHQNGGSLHPHTADYLAAALGRQRAQPRTIARWLPVLFASPASITTLGLVFSALQDDAHMNVGILLLDHLLAPRPVLRSTLTAEGDLGLDITTTGSEYVLRHAWSTYFSPRIESIAGTVVTLAERHLRTAHLILRSDGRAGADRDLISLSRTAIAATEQNQPPQGIDVLIDIARDSLSALARTSPEHAQSVADMWVGSEVPLLRRLAVYCYAQRDDISPGARIRWLLNTGLLYNLVVRPEAFDLLAALIPNAHEVRGPLLAAVLAGPDASVVPENSHHAVMTLLDWLTRHAPDFAEAKQALNDLQLQHRDFVADPDANRIFKFTMSWVGERSPRTSEQLREMRAPEDIDWLRDYRGEAMFSGPTRLGLLWEVGQAAAADVEWSLIIATGLADAGNWESDLWPELIQGWTQALPTATTENLVAILNLLTTAHYPAQFKRTATFLVAVTGQSEPAPQVLDRCQHLATSMWAASREHDGAGLPDFDVSEENFFVWSAVAHWIGDLTVAVIQIAAQRWQADRDAWTGLPPALREQLEEMLDIAFLDPAAVLSVSTRSLAWLCLLDEQWTATNLIPSFDWTRTDDPDHHRAEVAWQGFLTHAAWNGQVLGFLEPYFADAFAEMDDKLRKAVVETVANIAVTAPAHDEIISHMISVFISMATDDERKEWARSVGWLLGKIPDENAEAAWESWILNYWTQRHAGLPRSLSREEVREMLTWVPTAGRHFPAAVELLTKTDAEFDAAYLFFTNLEGSRLLADHPLATSKAVAFVLDHCHEASPVCTQIEAVITSLIRSRTPGTAKYLKAACHDAGRLGCANAMQWLDELQNGESD